MVAKKMGICESPNLLKIIGAPGPTRTGGTRIRNHPFYFRKRLVEPNKIKRLKDSIILSLLSRVLGNVSVF
jgi:hypothetical protein